MNCLVGVALGHAPVAGPSLGVPRCCGSLASKFALFVVLENTRKSPAQKDGFNHDHRQNPKNHLAIPIGRAGTPEQFGGFLPGRAGGGRCFKLGGAKMNYTITNKEEVKRVYLELYKQCPQTAFFAALDAIKIGPVEEGSGWVEGTCPINPKWQRFFNKNGYRLIGWDTSPHWYLYTWNQKSDHPTGHVAIVAHLSLVQVSEAQAWADEEIEKWEEEQIAKSPPSCDYCMMDLPPQGVSYKGRLFCDNSCRDNWIWTPRLRRSSD